MNALNITEIHKISKIYMTYRTYKSSNIFVLIEVLIRRYIILSCYPSYRLNGEGWNRPES